jgi:SAM-dependent methyltransferase
MCNQACIDFGIRNLRADDVRGRHVLEVGARDDNGSLRSAIVAHGPARYLGVDIAPGPGVDEICDAGDLLERYGPASFDVVVTTEMLEHVRDWRGVVGNIKGVLRGDGVLVLTTRSFGYPYHGAPSDYWRYEPEDIATIFADFSVEALERDPISAGVFARLRKKLEVRPAQLAEHELYSIVTGRRSRDIGTIDVLWFLIRSPRRLASLVIPDSVKGFVRRLTSAG